MERYTTWKKNRPFLYDFFTNHNINENRCYGLEFGDIISENARNCTQQFFYLEHDSSVEYIQHRRFVLMLSVNQSSTSMKSLSLNLKSAEINGPSMKTILRHIFITLNQSEYLAKLSHSNEALLKPSLYSVHLLKTVHPCLYGFPMQKSPYNQVAVENPTQCKKYNSLP
jgi:hypothetical protein